MGNASQARLEALRAAVGEVDPSQARADQSDGALLIDVREPDEVRGGMPSGAVHLRRGFLELKIEEA
jgi:rhodanese-related sulfurtransferase